MLGWLVLVAALLLTTGCSASRSASDNPNSAASGAGSLDVLAKGPGSTVALVAGASDFAPGMVRYPFLVVDDNGASIERPTARVWVAHGRNAQPFQRRKK